MNAMYSDPRLAVKSQAVATCEREARRQRVQRLSDWEESRYSVVPPRASRDGRLQAIHLRLLIELGRVNTKQGWCEFSQKALAEVLGVARQTLNIATGELVEWGFVQKKSQQQTGTAFCQYRVIVDSSDQPVDVSPTDDTPPSGDVSPTADTGVSQEVTPVSAASTDTHLDQRPKINNPLPPKGGPSPFEIHQAFEAYNETALRLGLPQAAKLTPDRQRKLRARLSDYGVDGWAKALANIERSKFLRGLEGDRRWVCNLDFLISPSGFSKVHDAVYVAPSKFALPKQAAPSSPPVPEKEAKRFERGTPEFSRIVDDIRKADPAHAATIELRGWVKSYVQGATA